LPQEEAGRSEIRIGLGRLQRLTLDAKEILQRSLEDLTEAEEAEPGIPHVATTLWICRNLLGALKAGRIDQICSFIPPALPEDSPQLFSPELADCLRSLGGAAEVLGIYLAASAAVTKRSAMVQAQSRLDAAV